MSGTGQSRPGAVLSRPWDARVPVPGPIVIHEVERSDDVVVYVQDERRLLLLNPVGGGIVHLCNGRRTVSEIADLVTEAFDAEAAVVQVDVVRFLAELEQAGVLRFG